MKIKLFCFFLVLFGVLGALMTSWSQTPKVKSGHVIRIKIRSADPALIAMLLKGHQVYELSPEISTINKTKK